MSHKVADLFCGSGGISEGFRLAGFEIVYALDKDNAAVKTFQENHPRATVEKKDVSQVNPNDIPDFDILVGGPPCVNFSTSKGGRANVLDGLRLVQSFLRVVYERNPKYWIMENVPRIALHLPESIPLKWIGIDKPGELEIPLREKFNVADYGVPQLRHRYLIGKYPKPIQTYCDTEKIPLFLESNNLKPWKTLRGVIEAFPDPLSQIDEDLIIQDPNYNTKIGFPFFTDHYYDSTLGPEEARKIRMDKTEHPFMGRMSFPDGLDRPARTVVATQLGRETLVIECNNNGKKLFRRLTVRECATIQSFPISYQFFGNSIGIRHRLAGDSVPPKLTYSIGLEILKLEGITEDVGPHIIETPINISPPLNLVKRRKKKVVFPELRRFRRMVPGKEVRGCRVDFDNQGSNPSAAIMIQGNKPNLVAWSSTLFVGEGKANLKRKSFTVEESLWEFAGVTIYNCIDSENIAFEFINECFGTFSGNLPDATTLQAIWTKRIKGEIGPHEIADLICDMVSKYFPRDKFRDLKIPNNKKFDIIPKKGLRIRIAAALVATAMVSDMINFDPRWVLKNQKDRYLVEGWKLFKKQSRGSIIANPADLYSVIVKKRKFQVESE